MAFTVECHYDPEIAGVGLVDGELVAYYSACHRGSVVTLVRMRSDRGLAWEMSSPTGLAGTRVFSPTYPPGDFTVTRGGTVAMGTVYVAVHMAPDIEDGAVIDLNDIEEGKVTFFGEDPITVEEFFRRRPCD